MTWMMMRPPQAEGLFRVRFMVRAAGKFGRVVDVFPSVSLIKQLSDDSDRRCDILIGDGDEAGQIRIKFRRDGVFLPCTIGKTGARVLIPWSSAFPDGPTGSAEGVITAIDQNDCSVTVAIPKDWPPAKPERRGGARKPKPKQADPVAAAPPAVPAGKIDIAAFFANIGENAVRGPDGAWRISGDRYTDHAVLISINKHRARRHLPAVGMGDLV